MAHAQLPQAPVNFCQAGGQQVNTQGLLSSTRVQASYPLCTVTVHDAGTINISTIFSTSGGGALTNPFTANSDGSFLFFASSAVCYDVTISGGTPPNTLPAPFTYSNICIGNGGGGGGTGTVTLFTTVNSSGGLLSTGVTNPATTPQLTISLPSNSPANQIWGNCTGAPATSAYCAITTGMLPFTYTGNTTKLATSTGALTNGHCVQIDASGNLVDSGGVCGGGGGTPGGSNTQVQYNCAGAFCGAGIAGFLPNALTFTQATGKVTADIFNGIRYVTSDYNWSQAPAGTVSVGANTVSLTPCPAGIIALNSLAHTFMSIHIGTVGTPEDVVLTATTCTQNGGANGTVTFTAVNVHGAGFSLSSSSTGMQEAINAAGFIPAGYTTQKFGRVIVPPGQYTWTAKVVEPYSQLVLDFSGALITCNMSDDCLYIGDPANALAALDVKVENFTGAPNIVNGNFSMIRSNAQGAVIHNAAGFGVGNSKSFGHLVQNDNDQNMIVDGLNANAGGIGWSHCGTDFCSSAYLGTGGGGNAGIAWIKNSNLTMNCGGNAVDNQNDNKITITDSIIQAYSQFGVRAGSTFGNNPALFASGDHWEIGTCTNPLGIGIAGLIVRGGYATVLSSDGPIGKAALFANTGGTQYNYWVVTHSTTQGDSAPMYAGVALTNGAGNITVSWPQVGITGTVTYNVLRTTGTAFTAPYTANCGGGTPTTCGSVATGLTQGAACAAVGSTNICTFVDGAANNTAAYTVTTPTYILGVPFWQGAIVYADSVDRTGVTPAVGYVFMDRIGDNVANSSANPVSVLVSNMGLLMPRFVAMSCNGLQGGQYIQCFQSQSNAAGGGGPSLFQRGTYNSSQPSGLKGTVQFTAGAFGAYNGGDFITITDNNSNRTLSTQSYMPSAEAADTAIGLDNTSQIVPSNAQLSFRAPISISRYINSLADNTNWKERLTGTQLLLAVPPLPSTAAGVDVGSAALPFANLWLGTAATNNFKLAPAATVAARTITMPDPLGNVNMPYVIVSGTSTMAAGSVAGATCATAITTAATGTQTTDSIEWAYATAPTLATDALLQIDPYVTANNVNFTRCNTTAGAIVGTAIVINWRVIR